jgi:hypothetical protein
LSIFNPDGLVTFSLNQIVVAALEEDNCGP